MSTERITPDRDFDWYRDNWLPEFNNLVWKQVDRMLLVIPLIALVFIQISLASEVFDPESAAELQNLVSIAGYSIGAYDIIGHMLLAWMLIPTLQILALGARTIYREVKA